MSKFKFKYEKILNLIQSKETQVQNNLSTAHDELNFEKSKLEGLIREDVNYTNMIENSLKGGCKLYMLRSIEQYKKTLSKIIKQQYNKISQKEKKVEELKNNLIEISKEKKIMEKLKEKNFESYKQDLKLIEEKNIDQLVTYSNSVIRR